ncbi:MAG: helix-turn-helix domain-containing protein [Clostridia bacterium]|nr:helix-turn-helix domain-containing protein [Clostridia bacterium]
MNHVLHHPIGSNLNSMFTAHHYTGQESSPQLALSHFHKDFEFALVTEGSVSVSIEHKEYVLQTHESVLVHPFQVHSIRLHSHAHIWIATCSVRYIPSLHDALAGQEARYPVFRLSDEVREFILHRMLPSFGNRFRQTVLTKQQEFVIKTCFYALGCDYMNQVELVSADLGDKSVTVDVAHYIAKHFTSDISLRDVAEQLGYNYQYLSRTFNKTIGINFKQLLNQYRMEYAIELLIKTERSITDIAYASGFQSLRSFYRVCQEMFQKPPKELRARE